MQWEAEQWGGLFFQWTVLIYEVAFISWKIGCHRPMPSVTLSRGVTLISQ